MKTMKKLSIILGLVSLAFCASSCLKDQADIFDKSPAERMQAYLEDFNKVLEAPEYGWKIYVFPIYSGAPTAGYVYTATF